MDRRTIRRFGRVGTLVLATFALVSAGPGPVAAQDEENEIAALPGIQAGVTREWQIPFSWSTPEPGTGPQAGYLGATILQFDTEAHAKESFAIAVEGIGQTPADEATPDVPFFVAGDFGADLGDERAAFQPEDDAWIPLRSLVVRDGDLIYLVVGTGNEGGDPSEAMVAITRAMLAREAGPGAGTLVADGTSSGGLWDKLPAADDPALAGLTSISDSDPLTSDS